ncbi:phage tail tape measure protein [Thalassotalea sp. 1_MG-2023]|uniref:phage tail tape measure protein n=1 Tax=Thalassotalea sp. 1_MG-2023 TaxID=3062680 RepID=UPI0026E46E0A|nr:phage tail tape measure protein [Thalassotalea sp. 1_MG-2023]MDO6426239.1 phage tail tape measure protein [Thalassotalea sp. 1_MG-2023]
MSSLSKLEKLMYTIGVVDKASAPVNKIMSKINQMSAQANKAQDQMMKGFVGAAAGGVALNRSLMPAIDHMAALGEVQSLGVAQSGLEKLTKSAFEFGSEFGGNSAEFVRSAYDIQSAIGGLTENDLSSFTKTSNILAKATKADASTITSYMGTMYGIFEKNANKMGKSNWVDKIAGQTASAVNLYKTTGSEMQAAFSNLSNTGSSVGLNAAQQFAMVGQLQLVAKSGSVAGTQAEKFIQGVGKAEKMLGLKLTKENGDMIAIDLVLGKINNKLKSLGSVEKLGVLTKVFGEQGAKAVNVLSEKVKGLNSDIKIFENIQDGSKAVEMAKIIASPWDRLSGSFNAAATAMGQRLLPVVEPFVEKLSTALYAVVGLTERFPILTSTIATTVVGVVGLMTAVGLFNIVMGLSKYGMIGFSTFTKASSVVLGLFSKAVKASRIALLSFHMQSALSGGALGAMRVGLMAATTGAWAFTTALLANPLTWIIAGGIAIYKYWQPIKALMSGFWDGLTQGFGPVTPILASFIDKLGFVGDLFSWLGEKASGLMSWFSNLLTPVNQTSEQLLAAGNAGKSFGTTVANVFKMLTAPMRAWFSLLNDGIGLLKTAGTWVGSLFGDDTNITATKTSKLESLPVNNVVPINIAQIQAEKAEKQKTKNKQLAKSNYVQIEKSAIAQQFSNSLTNNSNSSDQSKHVHIDGLTIKSENALADIEQLMELAG